MILIVKKIIDEFEDKKLKRNNNFKYFLRDDWRIKYGLIKARNDKDAFFV